MCTIAAAGLAVSLAGTAMAAVSTVQQQRAQNKQMRYQATVAENNAQAAEYEGNYAKAEAEKEAQLQQRRVASIVGSQRAAAGSSGLAVDSGTFMDLTLDTAEQGKIDEMAILREGDMSAWRVKVGADNYRTQAGLYRASQQSAFLPAVGQLMTGIGSAGMGYYSATQSRPKIAAGG